MISLSLSVRSPSFNVISFKSSPTTNALILSCFSSTAFIPSGAAIIDKNFIGNLTTKTAIIGCGKINIEEEVTEDMLQSKGVVFYDIHKIVANKELHGYIQANSNQVARICTPEESGTKKSKKRFLWWK